MDRDDCDDCFRDNDPSFSFIAKFIYFCLLHRFILSIDYHRDFVSYSGNKNEKENDLTKKEILLIAMILNRSDF